MSARDRTIETIRTAKDSGAFEGDYKFETVVVLLLSIFDALAEIQKCVDRIPADMGMER